MRKITVAFFSIICANLVLVNFSCTKRSFSSDKNLLTNDLDSIQLWINESRNQDRNLILRKAKLEKAYNYAKDIKNDSLKTKLFSRISLSYRKINDSLKFRETNHRTLKLANKIEDSISIAEAHWDLGMFFKNKSVRDSAYYYYSRAQKIYEILQKNLESATLLNNMAIIQADAKDYVGSEISNVKAIQILKPLNNYQQLYQSYNILGAVTKELSDYDRAIEYYNKALFYQRKISMPNSADLTLKNNIGVLLQEQGKFSESITYFQYVLTSKNSRIKPSRIIRFGFKQLCLQ